MPKQHRTVVHTFGRKAFKQALKREDHLYVLISIDPKAQQYRYSSGAMSPVELSDWHDEIDAEEFLDGVRKAEGE